MNSLSIVGRLKLHPSSSAKPSGNSSPRSDGQGLQNACQAEFRIL